MDYDYQTYLGEELTKLENMIEELKKYIKENTFTIHQSGEPLIEDIIKVDGLLEIINKKESN